MNTLGGAQAGRPRPSVWPVYLTAVMIGFVGLSFLTMGFFQATGLFRLYAVYGLFGVVTAIGVVRLRSWGWWSVLVWVAIYGAV